MNTPGNKAAKQARRGASPPPPAPVFFLSNKIALVLGGADCLEADRAAALALFMPDYIVATNNAGRDYPGHVDHWVSMHPNRTPQTPGLESWVIERRKAGRPDAGQLWIPQHRNAPKGLERLVRHSPSPYGGSSGMLACLVVLKMLSCRAVLAGCPMMAEHRHYDDRRPWAEAPRYWGGWLAAVKKEPLFRYGIRSMSGKTRELLGAPDERWIRGDK